MSLLGAAALALAMAPQASTVPVQLGERVTTESSDGVVVEIQREDGWIPARADILVLEQQVLSYGVPHLKKFGLMKPLARYKRQYAGFLKGKKRMIAVTFFFDRTEHVRSGKWLTVMMAVAGGGDDYLHGLYDANAKRFQELSISADR